MLYSIIVTNSAVLRTCALRQSFKKYKKRDTRRMFSGVLSCSNTKTKSQTLINDQETAVCLFC